MWKWLTRRKSYVSKKEVKRLAKEGSTTWEALCREGKVKAIDNATKTLDSHIQWVGEDDDRIKEIKELQLLQDPICSKHHG